MLRAMLVLLLTTLIFATPLFGEGTARSFHLKDGSVVSGQLVGMEAGHYLVESPILGTIRIREEDLLAMTPPGVSISQPNGPADGGFSQQVDTVRGQILGNPALLQEVQALGNNPRVQAVLNDPSLLGALMSGNLQALEGNPQLQGLMQDPEFLRLVRAIAGSVPAD